MITVGVFLGFIGIGFLMGRWWGDIKYWQGHHNGFIDGYDTMESEVEKFFPWNASSTWLHEWAATREIEESLIKETEDYLKYRDA